MGDIRDERIRVGDLVMVVKPAPCCGQASWVGLVFVINGIKAVPFGLRSMCCGSKSNEVCAWDNQMMGFEISTLKKINPPETGETKEAYINLPQKVTA